jgi:uncharacterized membrane protein
MHPDKNEGIVEKRPTEVVSGLAIAATVYGFCAESALPNGVAAVLAVICGFGPLIVSNTVDRLRG